MLLDLVHKDIVIQVVFFPHGPLKQLVHPVFECIKTQNGFVADVSDEIGVFVRVAGIGHAHAACVCTVQLDHVLECVEVTLGLGHLFIVHHDVSVAELGTRQLFVRSPDPDVVLHRHGQMVTDQIFARTPQVDRLVVIKVCFDFVECVNICFTLFVEFLFAINPALNVVKESII